MYILICSKLYRYSNGNWVSLQLMTKLKNVLFHTRDISIEYLYIYIFEYIYEPRYAIMEKAILLGSKVCFPRLCSLANVSKWNVLMDINVSRLARNAKLERKSRQWLLRGGKFFTVNICQPRHVFSTIYLRCLFTQFRSRRAMLHHFRASLRPTFIFNYSFHITQRYTYSIVYMFHILAYDRLDKGWRVPCDLSRYNYIGNNNCLRVLRAHDPLKLNMVQ